MAEERCPTCNFYGCLQWHGDRWPFPWPEGGNPSPRGVTIIHLPGADYTVEATGDSGIHTGRDRWRTVCLRCEADGVTECAPYGHSPGVLHRNSTGHVNWIHDHHRDFHSASISK